jgi:predicted Fe-Mo cluster-binding NifX family protein
MRIAISAAGADLKAAVDPRFGRARNFLVYDLDSDEFEVVDNTRNLGAAQGAGIQAAKVVLDCGVEAVITGNCGPKAFHALEAARIKVYLFSGGTVSEAVEKYRSGELAPRSEANVAGHWS